MERFANLGRSLAGGRRDATLPGVNRFDQPYEGGAGGSYPTPGYYIEGAPSVILNEDQALEEYGRALQSALQKGAPIPQYDYFGNSGMNGGGP
jgi:hypothetical protein